jgi:hypothetical protein
MHDIIVENVTIIDSNRGLAIMPRWGSGSIFNVTFRDIQVETRFFSPWWWGDGEPIYITAMNASVSQGYTGIVSNIFFENILVRSENGILISGQQTKNPALLSNIAAISLYNLQITISKWSNESRAFGRDFRPALPPQTLPPSDVPINGIFVNFVNGITLSSSVFQYLPPWQKEWGLCTNHTSSTFNFDTENLTCIY